MEMKQTNRAKQALATKNRILSEGRKLILKKGFDDVTVDEISKKANVTVGTFYHYFRSKDEIILGLLPNVEDYYKKVRSENSGSLKKIIGYYTWFNNEIIRTNVPPDLIIQLFSSQKLLSMLEEDRIVSGIELIIEGQISGTVTKDYFPAYISKLIFSSTRGICFHWAMHPNSISLVDATAEIVTRLVNSFAVEETNNQNDQEQT